MKVGFIGLGIMSALMSANLQKSGYELVVWNRTKDKAEQLLKGGAEWGANPAEVAGKVDILFTMLSTPEVVKEVALGENGFLDSLKPNSLWVDSSTVNTSFSIEMAKTATDRKIRFLDAPVSGSKIPAEKGELVFLVGGEKEDVEECRPLFEAMGKRVIPVGGHGMETSMKLVVNLMLAQAMAVLSEAMSLGQSLGISQEMLFLLSLPVTPPIVAGKRKKIEEYNFEPEFPLKWVHKDLHMISTMAHEKGIALPIAHVAKETYGLAKQKGSADKDISAIYEFINSK